ncbi:LOG family protein [Marinobacter zhejiangensis]|uniref:Cytokinin riboside 5'-monophosphate phosphoribohydrolase n=1 Tax=Marinobacter zhejiangensis TaxID=488535 RepID=A0A1I4LK50_9GAMM|nr:TIGR00730 family Rossman fold protein [Marinobacter zhejiangensis]SFL90977.1 hypothetical protein SAMN04487963_0505 [Marinobacter zhejiangensis]
MNVAVFCGSGFGHAPGYQQIAEAFGRHLASEGIDLVFGGGKVGLMGVVADAVLAGGGRAYGVIPESLRERELAHPGLTRLDVVADMHQRKARMNELADAFVALPGGPGTMDELFEAWTWAQLGYHQKPCALLNAYGYYDHLLGFVDHMVNEGFLAPRYAEMLIVEKEPEAVVKALRSYQAPASKWSSQAE